jgi:hypothetical protein
LVIAALPILKSQHCPSTLGFLVFQAGCNLKLSVRFSLASYANKRQAEIVMSFAQ